MLADPLTFLAKLPMIFSVTPVLLPLTQSPVHILIRQGLHTLGPHRRLNESSESQSKLISTSVESNPNPRVYKSEYYRVEHIQLLTSAMEGYMQAMNGLSTEHEVFLNI